MNVRRISTAVALVIGLATCAGIAHQLDSRYSKTCELSALEDKLSLYMVEQRITSIQERLWEMEKVWGERFRSERGRYHDSIEELLSYMNPNARKEYYDLLEELQYWKARRDAILAKRVKKKGS